jgi:L-fucose isomerase-like protein
MSTLDKETARALIGCRIIDLKIDCWNAREHHIEYVNDVVEIVLDDGTILRPMVCETDFGEYAVEMTIENKGGRLCPATR